MPIRFYLSPIRSDNVGDPDLLNGVQKIITDPRDGIPRPQVLDQPRNVILAFEDKLPSDSIRAFDPPINPSTGRHRARWAILEVDAADHTRYANDSRLRQLGDFDPTTRLSALPTARRTALTNMVTNAGLDPSSFTGSDTLRDVFVKLREQIRLRVES